MKIPGAGNTTFTRKESCGSSARKAKTALTCPRATGLLRTSARASRCSRKSNVNLPFTDFKKLSTFSYYNSLFGGKNEIQPETVQQRGSILPKIPEKRGKKPHNIRKSGLQPRAFLLFSCPPKPSGRPAERGNEGRNHKRKKQKHPDT